MIYKYGEFASTQISDMKNELRKKIYFLLLIVDKNTINERYENVDPEEAIVNLQITIAGLNELFGYPSPMVNVSGLLESARLELLKKRFSFRRYRKLILDAGSEVLKIEEV